MNEHLPPIRRVVTADDAKGNSHIVEDAPAGAVRNVPSRPGYRAVNVWRTEQSPTRITAKDGVAEQQGILPPRNGTILRIIDFPARAARRARAQAHARRHPRRARSPGLGG